MKRKNHEELLPFYFGSVADGERIQTERKLLENPDVLIDYFDLKREIEAAETLPNQPSARVWTRLAEKMRRSPSRTVFAVSMGLAVAAGLAACIFLYKTKLTNTHESTDHGFLFEGGEPSRDGGVL